jgi:excisionase family DNA binding protein
MATNSGTEVTEFRKYLYKIPEAMVLLSMSRSAIYEQIRSGRLRSVQQGRARLIPAAAIRDYVARLEHEAQEETHYDETA